LPQETVCAHCGAILYRGFDPEPPIETAKRYSGICPNCGRKLSIEPKEVEIQSIGKIK
jgi:DNA-directed RNA polymerase subunit RPC12/RpoP